MADGGELAAAFRALAEDAAQAGEDIGSSVGRWLEDTADTEDGNVNRTLAADAENARALNAIRPGAGDPGSPGGGDAGSGGPSRIARLLGGEDDGTGAAAGDPSLGDQLDSAQEWAGHRLPLKGGPSGGFLVKRSSSGVITNYTQYDNSGNILRRVDLAGRPHAGIPVPHAVDYSHDVNPMGEVFPRALPVRPAASEELP